MSKVAWITGASSGLGAALAREMAQDGWCVVISARRAEALAEVARGVTGSGSIHPLPLDITDAGAVDAAIGQIEDTHGPIGQAVLNAGNHTPVRAATLDVADFQGLVDLNLMGTVHCLVPLVRRMTQRGSGRVAVVSSIAGFRGLPTSAAYGMTKAGLINMAEALKPELDGLGVTLQVVNPGFIRTPLTDKNTFAMPFLMDVDKAATAFYRGLQSNRFEIVFPRRMVYAMKVLRWLPAPLAFAVTRRLVPSP